MEVRTFEPDEALIYRNLRLRALADSPDAFGDTLAQAQSRADETWVARAREIAANSDREALFMAWDGATACGSIYIRAEAGSAHIYGMWVDPAHRRCGVGSAPLKSAISWAAHRQTYRVDLWVTEGNEAAENLYRHAGFRRTGRHDALRPGSTLRINEMVIQSK